MKIMFWIALCIIAVLTAIALLYLPWGMGWLIAAVVVYFLPMKKSSALWAGFWGVGLTWFIFAWVTDLRNQHILSAKMAAMFSLNGYVWMLLFTFLIGAITGLLGAWLGASLRKIIKAK